jgi:hypothetical protein
MNTDHRDASDAGGSDVASPYIEHRVRDTRVASRGAEGRSIGRRFWLIAGALGLVVFAVALVLSFVSVANANARIDRLKAHGIPVVVTMGRCFGNLAGSGSNVAGYQCRGSYRLGHTTYHEPIGYKTTFSPFGTTVQGLVDPSYHNSVSLASAIRRTKASNSKYVAPGILTIVFLALMLVFARLARRPTSGVAPSSHEGDARPSTA